MSVITSETTAVVDIDYSFPLVTATTNIMTSPFDNANLPDNLPDNEWIEGTIDSLKLVIKDDNIHFSMKLKPDDPNLITFDAYLGYMKDGVMHKMARANAEFVRVAIRGEIKGGRLRTKDGAADEESINRACDMAIKAPCKFQVATKGEFTNLKKLVMLD